MFATSLPSPFISVRPLSFLFPLPLHGTPGGFRLVLRVLSGFLSARLRLDTVRLLLHTACLPLNTVCLPLGAVCLLPGAVRLLPDTVRLLPDTARSPPGAVRLPPDAVRLPPDSAHLRAYSLSLLGPLHSVRTDLTVDRFLKHLPRTWK